jgi:adenosylmethionine-8-amino-7-oxononanoate aminotransferase
MSNRVQLAKERTAKVFNLAHAGFSLPENIFDYGKGVRLFDQDGKEYLDFSGGAMCAILGHGDERIAQAAIEQMKKVSYFYRSFGLNEQIGELAEAIVEVAPPNLTSFMPVNSGSEASDTAIKLAHQYHVERGNPQKSIVIGRWQSFHGMTLGALSVTGHTGRRSKFGELLFQWPKIPAPLCYRCPYGLSYPSCGILCARVLDDLINQVGSQYVSAFFAEPVGAASIGGMVPVPEYYPMIHEICTKHDVLFIDDEVVCGCGRTGKWFGIEHWGINPDMMIVGKGISGGYTPIAGLLISDAIDQFFTKKNAKFVHGHTLGGNPVSCAIALKLLNIIKEDKLIDKSASLGAYLRQAAESILSKHLIVGDIRGKGLMLGIELVKDKHTKEPFDSAVGVENVIFQKAKDKGCFIYPGTGTIDGISGAHFLVTPPFVISEVEIDEGLSILNEAIGEVEKEMSI